MALFKKEIEKFNNIRINLDQSDKSNKQDLKQNLKTKLDLFYDTNQFCNNLVFKLMSLIKELEKFKQETRITRTMSNKVIELQDHLTNIRILLKKYVLFIGSIKKTIKDLEKIYVKL